MKENKYDDIKFFDKYSKMDRSINGLNSAGEWHELQKILPSLKEKRLLDLGCGFGWHCIYAVEQGARSVIGIDISKKMLEIAKAKTKSDIVEYQCCSIEDINFPEGSFDVVLSSLAFHYVENFLKIAENVFKSLSSGGEFIFSVEHPIFTAEGSQNWVLNSDGEIAHFPVDNYFFEGVRKANFLGEEVIKYHKTLTTYLNSLIKAGFIITAIVEPKPSEEMLKNLTEMKNELRRPMMLIVSAKKM